MADTTSLIVGVGQFEERIDTADYDAHSCSPVALFDAAIDGLGLASDDPRGLTVTGGLPYFGGAGNKYSMHAFASMVE